MGICFCSNTPEQQASSRGSGTKMDNISLIFTEIFCPHPQPWVLSALWIHPVRKSLLSYDLDSTHTCEETTTVPNTGKAKQSKIHFHHHIPRGCPAHCRMLSSISGLYPPDTNRVPSVVSINSVCQNQNWLPNIPLDGRGKVTTLSLTKKHGSRVNR